MELRASPTRPERRRFFAGEPLLPPTLSNRLGAALAGAAFFAALCLCIRSLVRGPVTPGGVLLLHLPAILYPAGFAIAAWRVRPRAEFRRLFPILYLPVLLLALVLFLFAAAGVLRACGWLPTGTRAEMLEFVEAALVVGLTVGPALPVLLLVFARRAVLLLVVGIAGCWWIIMILQIAFRAMLEVMYPGA